MKPLPALLLLLPLLTPCHKTPKTYTVIPPDGINTLTIHIRSLRNSTGTPPDTILIHNQARIQAITTALNGATKEIAKFLPHYDLNFAYNDTTVTVLVNNERFKINGVSYRATSNISDILRTMIERTRE